mmetsp:Transcript_4427/g.7324  ORF Transcript_4427/g.7324 Transcript_4427/m.7324 type:complete len:247 (-) Transcript_4427:28-768(-)
MGSIAALIIFANRVMLCSQMPMHIHRAHLGLVVCVGVGCKITHVELAKVSHSNIRSSLGSDLKFDTRNVGRVELFASTSVGRSVRDHGRPSLEIQEAWYRKLSGHSFSHLPLTITNMNLVVSDILIFHKLTTSMGMQVITHIITLHLHVVAHLVKTRGTDHVALTIDLPSDGGVSGAHFIGARVTSGGASVLCNVLSHSTVFVDDHTTHHVRVEVGVIIHNGKDLPMHSNSRSNVLRLEGRKGLHV